MSPKVRACCVKFHEHRAPKICTSGFLRPDALLPFNTPPFAPPPISLFVSIFPLPSLLFSRLGRFLLRAPSGCLFQPPTPLPSPFLLLLPPFLLLPCFFFPAPSYLPSSVSALVVSRRFLLLCTRTSSSSHSVHFVLRRMGCHWVSTCIFLHFLSNAGETACDPRSKHACFIIPLLLLSLSCNI